MSFRCASTPQAKGKVKRAHPFWRNRLPSNFASEQIPELRVANEHRQALRQHRNQDQVHRDLALSSPAAWERARREKHSVLRPVPHCPWWPYIWSQRTAKRVGEDGRVAVGVERLRVDVPPRTRVIECQHPSGHYSAWAQAPAGKTRPVVLFTNRTAP